MLEMINLLQTTYLDPGTVSVRVAFVLRSTEVTPALFVLFSAQRRVHKSEVANSLELATELYTGFVMKPLGITCFHGTKGCL